MKLESTYGDKEESDINILKAKFNSCDVGMKIDDDINIELFFTKLEALRNEIGRQVRDQKVIDGLDSDGELSYSKMKSNVSQVLGGLSSYMAHVASAKFNKGVTYDILKTELESHFRLMKAGKCNTNKPAVERQVATYSNTRGKLCFNWQKNGHCRFGKEFCISECDLSCAIVIESRIDLSSPIIPYMGM